MKNDYISEIYEKDKLVLHPYEDFNSRGTYNRKLITKSDNIYLYDENGNKFIDGPGGMWCNNIGHGNKEIGEAIKNQIEKMDYCSPFSESNEVSAELASVLADLSPGDLNTVFFTTDGSTANETALRFVMFYNNVRGLKEKKLIISRHDAYHGSTYLSASCSGKERDKNNFDFADDIVHHLSSPNPFRKDRNLSDEEKNKKNPVVWFGKNQLTGDEIFLKSNIKTQELDSLLISGNVFMIQKDSISSDGYNQIKGEKLEGSFYDGKLKNINVIKNSIILYYMHSDDGEDFLGLNKTLASSILIKFADNEISEVSFYKTPDGNIFSENNYYT